MKTLTTIILLLTSTPVFAQFDYELYASLTSKETLELNKKVNKIIEYQVEKDGHKTQTSLQEFLRNGYPINITEFDNAGKVSLKKEFVYNSSGVLEKVETFKNAKHEKSTEFRLDQSGNIVNYTNYVYSSYDGEKVFVWETSLDYNPNGTLKKTVKLQGSRKDTSEVNFYDKFGILKKTIYNKAGLRTVKIEYLYNGDSTKMLEKHYESEKKVYSTITHKYKNNKEIERIDLSTSKKPFYWKYNDDGKVTETNENFFYVLYFKYSPEGRINNKTVEVLFSDSDERDLPKKIEFVYEYVLN